MLTEGQLEQQRVSSTAASSFYFRGCINPGEGDSGLSGTGSATSGTGSAFVGMGLESGADKSVPCSQGAGGGRSLGKRSSCGMVAEPLLWMGRKGGMVGYTDCWQGGLVLSAACLR